LLYGANGYTGELIARRAAELGMHTVLAGRDGDTVAALAAGLGLEHRAFPLTDPGAVRHGVADMDAVLHCAGPFIETSRPMVAACLDTATHYLDITGEIPVFEAVLGRGEAARRAGAVLLPGVGFDVVPTDCTAARLARAVPDAHELELAFVSDGALSRGTARTMIKSLPHLGAVRRDGRIVPVPAAWDAKQIELPLPDGGTLRRWVMTIPWGDVSTAFHTTGIPNIRVYSGAPPKTIRRLRRLRPLLPLLGWAPLKALQLRLAERHFAEHRGPDAAARASGCVHVWGRATAPDGRSAVASLTAPEGYELTVRAALECLRRVLAGDAEPGAHTPAGVFGPELVESIEGVVLGELVLSEG
jgi:saccharopine dehydrogenase (NAD+, L-lysine-forming)